MSKNKKNQFCVFYINRQLLGIDIRYIKEVNPNLNIYDAPLTAEYVRGLLNVRGKIVMIIDISCKFGNQRITISDKCHNIILKNYQELLKIPDFPVSEEYRKNGDQSIGLLVEELFDILEFDSDEILPPPAHLSEINARYISGVIKYKQKLLLVLNPLNLIIN